MDKRTDKRADRRTRYSPEVRERAVRLVREHRPEHPSQWAAIRSIASKLGCTSEAPRCLIWVDESQSGKGGGASRAAAVRGVRCPDGYA